MKTKPTDPSDSESSGRTCKNTDETPTKSAPETPAEDKACALPTDDSTAELQKLQKEIEALRKAATERDEFLKLLQRVQADFLNYQKRIKSERECWDKYQDENLLRELLPAFDNFGRTLKLECNSDEAKCIMDGVTLIKREVFRILEKRGLKQMKTLGEKFDPNLHEAVAVTEIAEPEGTASSEHKDHEILEEVAPGFMLNDRLIRAAKVRIAMKPKPKEDRGATASSEVKTSGEPQRQEEHK